MKQHITIKQWDEITKEQKDRLDNFGDRLNHTWIMDIGRMIEFLGDSWWDYIEARYYNDNNFILCDVLWEAIKQKLKKVK